MAVVEAIFPDRLSLKTGQRSGRQGLLFFQRIEVCLKRASLSRRPANVVRHCMAACNRQRRASLDVFPDPGKPKKTAMARERAKLAKRSASTVADDHENAHSKACRSRI